MKLIDNPDVTQENKIGLLISTLSPYEMKVYDKVGRNDVCPFCENGVKKFKKCHQDLYKKLTKNRR